MIGINMLTTMQKHHTFFALCLHSLKQTNALIGFHIPIIQSLNHKDRCLDVVNVF